MLYHKISPLIIFCHFREPAGRAIISVIFPKFYKDYKFNRIFNFFELEYLGKMKKTLIIFCHFCTKWVGDRVNQEMTENNQG